jgi:chlorobactene glucosyltransferase
MIERLWIDYWQVHPYTVVAFLAFCLLTALGNSLFLRRLGGRKSGLTHVPSVSILVPARNEAENIGTCVRSLLAQDYPAFEVIVLDDQSTDATGAILNEIQAEHPALKILSGQSLPSGWLGKNWACQQLAMAAGGELLLFTDADTWHAPRALHESVVALGEEQADMLTAFPREQVISWGEKLTVPILGFMPFAFVPVFLARLWRLPFLTVTIGQYMLFRRAAYEAVGGYERIRSHPVDDVMLGRHIASQGFKWLVVDGTDHVHCRMYRSFPTAVAGFTRTLFSFFDYHVLLYLVAWLWIGCIFLEPLLILLLNSLGMEIVYFPASLAWLAVVQAVALFALIYSRFRFPVALTALYPLSMGLFVGLAFRSLIYNVSGKHAWKDRELPRPRLRL